MHKTCRCQFRPSRAANCATDTWVAHSNYPRHSLNPFSSMEFLCCISHHRYRGKSFTSQELFANFNNMNLGFQSMTVPAGCAAATRVASGGLLSGLAAQGGTVSQRRPLPLICVS